MKIATLAGCVLALSLVGCAASSEAPSDPNPTTTTGSTVEGFKIPTTVVYPLWDFNNSRLYVAVCPLFMPMPSNVDAAHEAADCAELTSSKIQMINVLIRDASGKVIGDSLVSDRPGGGGCVHVDLPGIPVGSSLRILALVSDVPGAKREITVSFSSITTTAS